MKMFRRILVLVPVIMIGLLGWSGIFSSGDKTFTAAELNAKWKAITELEKKQQYGAAISIVEEILTFAKTKADSTLWTKALAKRVVLENALHGYESSVRLLLSEPWPQDARSQTLLNLYSANMLCNYYQAYSWEINQREKVKSKQLQDLKTWTSADIFQAIFEHYHRAWLQREILGKERISIFPDYIREGNYPGKIRKTLRDFLVYQWVDFLRDTSLWRPEQIQEKYKLSLEDLLAIPTSANPMAASNGSELSNGGLHPLQIISTLLNEHYQWYRLRTDDPESCLEAMLVKLECLIPHFTKQDEKMAIAKAYRELLERYEGSHWWAHGQYQYASLIQTQGDKVTAHQLAKAGYEKYPQTTGGKECLSLMKAIEAPAFSLLAMANDRSKVPSIQITHTNLPRLFFRVFRINIQFSQNMNYKAFDFGNQDELNRWIFGKKPDYTWETPLEDPGDYRSHITYEKLPVPEGEDGIYIVAASANPRFDKTKNQVLATTISLSTLTMIVNPRRQEKELEVWVRDGFHGDAVSGAKVTLYHYNYNSKTVAYEAVTDEHGLARISTQPLNDAYYYNSFIIATKGKQFTYYRNNIYPGEPSETEIQHQAFVYTDRSIYRPLQKVYYKVVAYEGDSGRNEYQTTTNQPMDVELVDPNGEVVATQKFTTNGFGSGSGEFVIPSGRLLGQYAIRVTGWGQANIRVEEYKRPTFEAKLLPSEEVLRLNKEARIKGEARYYFGMPVTDGKVHYRITREASYPWWYSWFYYWFTPQPPQEITAGDTALNTDGIFEIQFLPGADEGLPDKNGVSYRFRVLATITDSGGETKEAQMDYAIGFTAIEANIQMAQNFYLPGQNIDCAILRTNSSGSGQAGQGSYQLFLLKQPEETLRAYELPETKQPEKGIKGDHLRPRWTSGEDLNRTLFRWADGPQVASGQIIHDQAGHGKVGLANLKPGVYRLRYNTTDPWGAQSKAQKEFVVASDNLRINASHYLLPQRQQAFVGEVLPVIFGTGFSQKQLVFETWLGETLAKREFKTLNGQGELLSIPITAQMRGGFTLRLYLVEDYQVYMTEQTIYVPFDNKQLDVHFTTFRDLMRPGGKETWSLTVKGPKQEKVSAEILSYMYDRSLDYFMGHSYPNPGVLYQRRSYRPEISDNVATVYGYNIARDSWYTLPERPYLMDNQLFLFDSYSTGGPGGRKHQLLLLKENKIAMPAAAAPVKNGRSGLKDEVTMTANYADASSGAMKESHEQPQKDGPLRENFAETAYFYPHLLSDENGNVKIEFQAPDSVTSWNVYVHALTRDLKFMTLQKQTETRKELMIRPYLPRFFREGDVAVLKVVVNNAGKELLQGEATLEIYDPENNSLCLTDFKIDKKDQSCSWSVPAGQSTTLTWKLTAPDKIKTYAFKVMARSKEFSDGEVRPVPVLPSRMHLVQSQFATLKDNETRVLRIEEMKLATADASLQNEKLVVALDGQLIYTVLRALPYLVNYPYECMEQTMNRFLSTSIVGSLYDQYPPLAKMARDFSSRKTRHDPWTLNDPNRILALEETPWLETSRGGRSEEIDLINMFDTRAVKANQENALEKLRKAQLPDGGFPWFEGGPASDYMTVYILYGLAKAREFNVQVPEEMVRHAWKYVKAQYDKYYAKDLDLSFPCFMNYVLSCFPEKFYQESFSQSERMSILNRCFKNWKEFNPYRKALLALTLNRAKRTQDAKLVLASIMDSAITTKDQGTFWAREDRSWIWYNDHIESHALVLRALLEVNPSEPKLDGLALWILLNKKMNQWKSTRTTAEVIYSLALYMKQNGSLAVREEAGVNLGGKKYPVIFEPEQYQGRNQIVVEGEQVKPDRMAEVTVDKKGKGYMFASMTWHYSTEKLPTEGKGHVLAIKRSYFVRRNVNGQYVLEPLADGAKIQMGDPIEVKISITCKNPMEYVHLHDPRAAGLEPEQPVSGHRWDMGLYWYEEVRDSGANFFFEQLPQGEYTFKYRLRANMAGRFRVGPATIESMYAPEFAAFSAGQVMNIE
jgi:uncharacterized protein YfaS (alpha-2-macroglobulin family)